MPSPDYLLKKNHLRTTNCRQQMLGQFIAANIALTHSDIEHKLSNFDRVTIYRTLQTFLDKGIIHKIIDDEGSTQYALCNDCNAHTHFDEHLHFKCTQCQTIRCIDSVTIPALLLPSGYSYTDASILVRGICNTCNKTNTLSN